MREKVIGRRYGIVLFVSLILLTALISHSHAEEFGKWKYGFSVLGGAGDAWYDRPHMSVYGFLPRVDFSLHRKWDLELEGNFSYWAISDESNFYFLGVNGNVVFKPIQGNWGALFFLVGGGLGYDSAGDRVRQIGNSHLGGIAQGGVGIYYHLSKKLALRLEYRFYHVSEPTKADRGLNNHVALLGLSF